MDDILKVYHKLRKAYESNIETFTKTIFLICNKLFNMNIPNQLKGNIKEAVVEEIKDKLKFAISAISRSEKRNNLIKKLEL